MNWHIGCSGFHYREWKEFFYPSGLPQRKWFEYYSSHFDTLELNVTFYRFPQLKTLQNWYTISPGSFLFSVKVPRLITHYKQFNDCERLLDDFHNTVTAGLQEKLGAVLYQMPPSLSYTEDKLERIIKNIRPGVNSVLEFRHQSWWNNDVYKRLKDEQIIFCGISHPSLPDFPVVNIEKAYYRFHGSPKLYYSSYAHETLQRISNQIQSENPKQVFVYFNNTATMAAIENATWLKGVTALRTSVQL